MADVKACPLCGEEILAVAIRCKHCQADLSGKAKPPTAVKSTGGGALVKVIGAVALIGGMLVAMWGGSVPNGETEMLAGVVVGFAGLITFVVGRFLD